MKVCPPDQLFVISVRLPGATSGKRFPKLLVRALSSPVADLLLDADGLEQSYLPDTVGQGSEIAHVSVGVTPHPSRLCTNAAKDPAMIKWADGRASFGIVPRFVMDE